MGVAVREDEEKVAVMDKYELGPYPFCGGKARLWVDGGVRVICSKCYVSTMNLTDSIGYESNAVETVVAAWNRSADARSERRNNHAETSKASALRPVMQRVYP